MKDQRTPALTCYVEDSTVAIDDSLVECAKRLSLWSKRTGSWPDQILTGKPRLSSDGLDTMRRTMAEQLLTMKEFASRLGVGRTTLYRALGQAWVHDDQRYRRGG